MKTNMHCDHISLNSSWYEKCFRQKCREDKTSFMFNNVFFFSKIVPFMR